MNTDTLRQYVADKAELSLLEAKVKRMKATLRLAEQDVLTELSHSGTQRITIDGKTLYVRQDLYASVKPGVDPEAAMKVLDDLNLTEFHKERITLQSVSAWIRERRANDEEIPADFKAVFKAEPVFRVGVTNS